MRSILSPAVNILASLERIRSIELAALSHNTTVIRLQFFD